MSEQSRLIRTGKKRPWWTPIAIVGYLGLIVFPTFYLAIIVWEQSGADIIGRTEYTIERDRPMDIPGFIASLTLIGAPAAGFFMMLRKLKGLPARRR